MNRALWLVAGKVSALVMLAGVIGYFQADTLAWLVVTVGFAGYILAGFNLLFGRSEEPDTIGTSSLISRNR